MYASLTDFKQHYQEKGIEIAVSDQRLLDELKSAASEIDLYLTNVYVLPIVVSVRISVGLIVRSPLKC
jgi:phage gp36-like protein